MFHSIYITNEKTVFLTLIVSFLLLSSFRLRIINIMMDMMHLPTTKGISGCKADVMTVVKGAAVEWVLRQLPNDKTLVAIRTHVTPDGIVGDMLTKRI